jgi:hypothetical protein
MAGGGPVTFACDGTIALSNTLSITIGTVFDATGHQVCISGSNSVRVFYISTNVNVRLLNLTIADGHSDKGGGIFNAGGQVTLQNCVLINNSVVGPAGNSGNPGTNGYGGAVYNLGIVNALNCAFVSNTVVGGAGAYPVGSGGGTAGGHGYGGGIANSGTFSMTACVAGYNSATGGPGGAGVVSGQGGLGGDGSGGAVANFGSLTVSACLLTNNFCTGGAGGMGGAGTYNPGFSGTPGGPGGNGGSGNGGTVFNSGSASLVNDTFAFNSGMGGQGGTGGSGGPPWNQSTSSGNGGQGANGGSGCGAIYDSNGQCYLTNCTLALNNGIASAGGYGGPPGPWPYPYPPHVGSPGANGNAGVPGSGLSTAGTRLVNTLLASNSPVNCSGALSDAGHNLSSDVSPGFTGPGSLTNTAPAIGPLINNGGPTATMALLPGSPAIDAGDTSAAPINDQRGLPRPAGGAADIGAFEYGSMLPVLEITRWSTNTVMLTGRGNSNQWCRVLASSNLFFWTPVSTNQFGTSGVFLFQDAVTSFAGACRFYRIVMP